MKLKEDRYSGAITKGHVEVCKKRENMLKSGLVTVNSRAVIQIGGW